MLSCADRAFRNGKVLPPELNVLRLRAAWLRWRRKFSRVLRIEPPSYNRCEV